MCECLEYKDGDMYLCPVDVDIYKEMQAKLDEQAKEIERLKSDSIIAVADRHALKAAIELEAKLRKQVEAAGRLAGATKWYWDSPSREGADRVIKALAAYEETKRG